MACSSVLLETRFAARSFARSQRWRSRRPPLQKRLTLLHRAQFERVAVAQTQNHSQEWLCHTRPLSARMTRRLAVLRQPPFFGAQFAALVWLASSASSGQAQPLQTQRYGERNEDRARHSDEVNCVTHGPVLRCRLGCVWDECRTSANARRAMFGAERGSEECFQGLGKGCGWGASVTPAREGAIMRGGQTRRGN